METNNAPTYADYLAYVATLNTEVDAYTEKQWDTMPSANKFGLNVLIRRQRAGKALSV
jgi:hypothetical protein